MLASDIQVPIWLIAMIVGFPLFAVWFWLLLRVGRWLDPKVKRWIARRYRRQMAEIGIEMTYEEAETRCAELRAKYES